MDKKAIDALTADLIDNVIQNPDYVFDTGEYNTVGYSTSFAFVKDDSLYIPTCFFSFTGAALDKKTPLLRSMTALSEQALRIMKLFGDTDVKNVLPTVGAEQEYFLLPRDLYSKRDDLRLTGRTLFGANAPKGQELEDHYFGSIKQKVSEFMQELDYELWKYGVPSKTKHNETAPSQHEVACIYRNVNITINGSMHTPCDYVKLYDRMKKYINDVNYNEKEDFEAIAYAHLQLAKLHPFLDANGRLARLILNFFLIKYGYAPVSIPAKRRLEYFDMLEEFKVNKNPVPFENFVKELVEKEYDRMIEMIQRYNK